MTRVRSQDPAIGQEVVVEVGACDGRVLWDPPAAVINVGRLDGDGPLLHTCCGVTHFYTSANATTGYLGARAGLRGQVLGQREAVEAAQAMVGDLLAGT